MQAPTPLPLTILTGPTGAGKTSLLNLALSTSGMAGTLAIQNEAGRTLLDASRAIVADGEASSLAGCLCCGPRDELSRLFEDLLRRRDNQRIAPFARIVFETSGVADPARIVAAIGAHPYLSRRYQIAGIVAVLDPARPGDWPPSDPAKTAQIEAADAIVLRSPGDCQFKDQIARINRFAQILDWPSATDAPSLFAPFTRDPARRTEGARRSAYRHALGHVR